MMSTLCRLLFMTLLHLGREIPMSFICRDTYMECVLPGALAFRGGAKSAFIFIDSHPVTTSLGQRTITLAALQHRIVSCAGFCPDANDGRLMTSA